MKSGASLGNGGDGHCGQHLGTTCLSAPATEASLLATESGIMLSHVLANNPRVGYAHQSNLIGSANPSHGYTILALISAMLTQYTTGPPRHWSRSPTPPRPTPWPCRRHGPTRRLPAR